MDDVQNDIGDGSQAQNAEALIDEIRELLRRENLDEALTLFDRLHPADQGDLLVDLPEETRQDIIGEMTYQATAEIFEYIDPDEAVQVAAPITPRLLADILNEADPDVAADVLRGIPDEQTAQTLEAMTESREVIPLLEYADDTAGGLMNPEFLAVSCNLTAVLALDVIRIRARDAEVTSYALVVDEENKLVGHAAIVDLALARDEQIVAELAQDDVVSVTVDTDQEECARIMQRYNMNELPVVDGGGVLRGIIMGDDVLDVLKEEATEDMYRLAGVGEEAVFGPLTRAVKSRLPWLGVNLATAFLAALAIGLFETTIGKVVALAVLLPLVTSQGGMGGIQTLTLAVRSMALGELAEHAGNEARVTGTDPRDSSRASVRLAGGDCGVRLEGRLYAGRSARGRHAGQYGDRRVDGRRRATALEKGGTRPRGIFGGVYHHIHRHHGYSPILGYSYNRHRPADVAVKRPASSVAGYSPAPS